MASSRKPFRNPVTPDGQRFASTAVVNPDGQPATSERKLANNLDSKKTKAIS